MQKYNLLLCFLGYFCLTSSQQKMSVLPQKTRVEKNVQKKSNASNKRTIEIINAIDETMLTVHQFGAHKPTRFKLSVNDTALDKQKAQKITINNNELAIGYEYEFAHGLYKGSKVVHCDVAPDARRVIVAFSWKDPLRIQAEGAVARSIEPVKNS